MQGGMGRMSRNGTEMPSLSQTRNKNIGSVLSVPKCSHH